MSIGREAKTHSEVDLAASHYIIQEGILPHHLQDKASVLWKIIPPHLMSNSHLNGPHLAQLHAHNTRVLVAFLLLFLFTVHTFKLRLRQTKTARARTQREQ